MAALKNHLITTRSYCIKGFPGGSAVKNPRAMQESQETRVQSPGQDDPLVQEMATHSSVLAWRIPWTEESGRIQSMGHKELDTTEQLSTGTYFTN